MKISLFALTLIFSIHVFAINIKVATLVPKGTSWAKTMQSMADEVKDKTSGKVKIKIYYGGVQGDEPDVLRKTRIGQLHGGVFTGKTLGEIYADIRAIEIPFNFYHDDQKAMSALDKNSKQFNAALLKQGYVNLGFYGIGKVYVVSTKKVTNINELKGIKMWAWEGDKLIQAMMESLGLVSVPLALPDVMSSLSTGIIEAAYAPPLAVLALQWQNKIKYIIDFPTAYSIGALLITKTQWDKISSDNQKVVMEVANKYVHEANTYAKKDNIEALNKLKSMGVEMVSFSKKDLDQAELIRNNVIKKLEHTMLSKEIIKSIEKQR